jgi:hypothetical protein
MVSRKRLLTRVTLSRGSCSLLSLLLFLLTSQGFPSSILLAQANLLPRGSRELFASELE